MSTDDIYSQARDHIDAFAFNDSVAEVFSDMINRSVPGYAAIIRQIARLAGRYAQADSTVYDLAAALGPPASPWLSGLLQQTAALPPLIIQRP